MISRLDQIPGVYTRSIGPSPMTWYAMCTPSWTAYLIGLSIAEGERPLSIGGRSRSSTGAGQRASRVRIPERSGEGGFSPRHLLGPARDLQYGYGVAR